MAKPLPLFAIQHLEDDAVVGMADASRWIGVGHIVALVLGNRFIWGKWRDGVAYQPVVEVGLHSTGAASRSAALLLPQIHTVFSVVAPCRAGASPISVRRPTSTTGCYPFIDSYRGDRAELVLDSSTSWRRSVFAPVNAVSVTHPGGGLITKAGSDDVSRQIVAGAWDHEHCEVCYQKIGTGGQAVGWANSEEQWVCQSCYVAYVAARSLEFVSVESPTA